MLGYGEYLSLAEIIDPGGDMHLAQPCIFLDKLISYRFIRACGELVPTLRLLACDVDEVPHAKFSQYTEWYPSPFFNEMRLHVQGE